MVTPTRDEFIAAAGRGNLIPVYRELLADSDTGVASSLVRLAGDAALRARMQQHLRADPPRQDWTSTVAATVAEYRRAGAPG